MRPNRCKTRMVVVIFFFFGIVSLKAQSNQRQRQKPPTFDELLKRMDTNNDNKLSKEEVKGPLQNHFSKIDTNEDGFISKTEFAKAPKPKERSQRSRR